MSGRYQSKVFNFFSRQSLRLRDQSAQTWRQVKVAAVWGVQILLYPIYVGFQALRLTGKQLKQAVRQTWPRLRAAQQTLQAGFSAHAITPSVDRPIHETLRAIALLEVSLPDGQNTLLLPAAASSNPERELAVYIRQHPDHPKLDHAAIELSPESTAPDLTAVRIQGVASLLVSQRLVLVTTRNQILDILSLEQQTQLARRIVWETASYWRQQRLVQIPAAPLLVSNYLPLPKPQKHALLPIRLFQKTMAWMQRGSVAIAANLFQESRLAIAAPAIPLSFANPNAQLKSAQPTWEGMEAQFYNWMAKAGQTTGALFVAGLETGTAVFSKLSVNLTNSSAASIPPQLPPAPANHRSLPQLPAAKLAPSDWIAAIDRWISKIPGLKDAPATFSAENLPAQNVSLENLPAQMARSPWPAVENSLSPQLSNPAGIPGTAVPTSYPAAESNLNWLKRSLRKLLPNQSALSSTKATGNPPTYWELIDTATIEIAIKARLAKLRSPKVNGINKITSPQPSSRQSIAPVLPAPRQWDADLHGVSPTAWAIEHADVPLSSLDTANLEEAAMVPHSWIETEAQLVSYVKHPLEQVLEWIDKGMAWVEEQIAKLWHWLTYRS